MEGRIVNKFKLPFFFGSFSTMQFLLVPSELGDLANSQYKIKIMLRTSIQMAV